jgi:SPP1 family predicted phage head-tail adaptor
MATKKTNIGQLNQRIVIQQETASRGDFGQEILTWSDLTSCWSLVEFSMAGSGEGIAADQIVVTTRADFTIRQRNDINEKMRIVYNGSNYGILNIKNTGRSAYMTIQAHKVE